MKGKASSGKRKFFQTNFCFQEAQDSEIDTVIHEKLIL